MRFCVELCKPDVGCGYSQINARGRTPGAGDSRRPTRQNSGLLDVLSIQERQCPAEVKCLGFRRPIGLSRNGWVGDCIGRGDI